MPQLEVEENDVVLVFRRRTHPGADGPVSCFARIYVGTEQLGMVSHVEAYATLDSAIPTINVGILSNLSIEQADRLDPGVQARIRTQAEKLSSGGFVTVRTPWATYAGVTMEMVPVPEVPVIGEPRYDREIFEK